MRPTARKTVTLALTFLCLSLAVKWFLPLFSPFLAGLLLALAAEPVTKLLTRRAHMPRRLSCAISVTMAFAILTMIFFTLCALLLRQLRKAADILPGLESTASLSLQQLRHYLLQLSTYAPQSLQPMLQTNLNTLFSDGASLLGKLTSYLLSLAGNLLTHVPDSALSLGTAILSGYMIAPRLPRLRRWLRRHISKDRLAALTSAARRIRSTCLSWLTAQCKLTGLSFLILAAGFLILRIPNALFLAGLTCLVDALPVFGTGTVLLPWSAVLFLQSDTPRAIGLLGLYATVSLTRSAMEPRLLSRHLGLDPLVTLMALYIGFRLWGIPGLLFAPIFTVASLQLLPEAP